MYYEIPKNIEERRKELSQIKEKSSYEDSETSVLSEISRLAEDGYFVTTKMAHRNDRVYTSVYVNETQINWAETMGELIYTLMTISSMICVKKGVA